MTHLEKKIIQLITTQGPIDVSQYMLLSMDDPQYGYYKTANPFGQDGDFITAPEISQTFGEMIAVWAIITWKNMGDPSPVLLCEIGPGRGTLMDDILRTIGKLEPEYLACMRVFLVETSPRLVIIQRKKLRAHNVRIEWIVDFTKLPDLPLVLISNEFFDVLPIHQYVLNNGHFRERMISVDKNGHLCFSLGPDASDVHVIPSDDNTPGGIIMELSPARLDLAQAISKHLAKNRGAALIIDYGAIEPSCGDTLQAISKHSFRNPLENPGSYDLTSHVDFSALAQAVCNSGCHTAILTQGAFLIKLGLLERAKKLGSDKNETLRQKITADVKRLAAPDQMGELFKVFCIADPETTMLPFAWQASHPNND